MDATRLQSHILSPFRDDTRSTTLPTQDSPTPQPSRPALWALSYHRGRERGPEPSFPVTLLSLTLDMETCGDPSTPAHLLGIPVASSGYLHPAQLLETGLSCLPYPTLFLLRSRLALSLPFSFIITPSMEKLLAAGQRQGCPQRRFPSWNISPLLRCSSTWTSPHRFRDK